MIRHPTPCLHQFLQPLQGDDLDGVRSGLRLDDHLLFRERVDPRVFFGRGLSDNLDLQQARDGEGARAINAWTNRPTSTSTCSPYCQRSCRIRPSWTAFTPSTIRISRPRCTQRFHFSPRSLICIGSLADAEPAEDAVQDVFRIDRADDLGEFIQRQAEFGGDEFLAGGVDGCLLS